MVLHMIRILTLGTSLGVQWLTLCTSTAGDSGLIPGQGTKIPHVEQRGQKIKRILAFLSVRQEGTGEPSVLGDMTYLPCFKGHALAAVRGQDGVMEKSYKALRKAH